MSVDTPDFTHSFAYTNTVSRPVRMNAHMIQLPLMPSVRITCVKKLAESVAVVAATIENPISHHGIECPELKKSPAVPRLLSEASVGMRASRTKNAAMTAQS